MGVLITEALFRGLGPGKGLFITTGTFTLAAVKEVANGNKRKSEGCHF